MMARLLALAFFLLAGTASAQTLTLPPPNFRQNMPADVTAWLTREEQCTKWYAEDPSDPKKAKAIDEALAKNKCDQLDSDYDDLRATHHDDANILNRLSQAEDFYSATD